MQFDRLERREFISLASGAVASGPLGATLAQPVAIEPHEEKPIGPLLASTGLVIALIMGW